MSNVSFIDITDPLTTLTETYALIDNGNGQFTTMAKSVYDAQQAANTLPSESSIPTTPQAGE